MGKRSRTGGWGKAVPWIALMIAVYGAVLSTIQWRDSRAEKARRLQVRLLFGTPIAKGKQHRAGLQIKAANPGYQPVMVTTAGVLFPNGRRFCVDRAKGDWEFGSAVPPGENKTVLLAGQDLLALCDALLSDGFRGTVTLVGFYEDALNDLHRSDPFAFEIDDARRLAHSEISRPPAGTARGQSP